MLFLYHMFYCTQYICLLFLDYKLDYKLDLCNNKNINFVSIYNDTNYYCYV